LRELNILQQTKAIEKEESAMQLEGPEALIQHIIIFRNGLA
jgi:hypothetical protein